MASHTNGKEIDSGEQSSSQLTSPTALRKLVLNYLIHYCYTDTAQAFAHDGISAPSGSLGGDCVGAEASTSGSRNGKETVNRSSSSASGSTVPSGRSQSRLTNQQMLGSAHPLSAPPLSREDSSMEIEVDSLLSLAGGRGVNGNGERIGSNGHGNGAGQESDIDGQEDTQMGESSQIRERTVQSEPLSNEELTAEELQSVRIRSGK